MPFGPGTTPYVRQSSDRQRFPFAVMPAYDLSQLTRFPAATVNRSLQETPVGNIGCGDESEP